MNEARLFEKLMEASAQIHKASTRGSGNFLVAGTQFNKLITQINRKQKCQTILQKIKEWKNKPDTI